MSVPFNLTSTEEKPLTLEEKCRQIWHINERMLPILKLVFLQGSKVSKASKSHDYNGSYVATVIRRLRANGHEADIKQSLLQDVEQDTLDNMENDFWDSLSKLVKAGDIKALQLYADIKGLIQKHPTFENNIGLTIEEIKKFMEED